MPPPLQSFDFAKMLTDSGKLHVLDVLLKRLRAGNHRVPLFAQMTKMLNILKTFFKFFQDNFAIQSYEKAIAANNSGAFKWEIVPVVALANQQILKLDRPRLWTVVTWSKIFIIGRIFSCSY